MVTTSESKPNDSNIQNNTSGSIMHKKKNMFEESHETKFLERDKTKFPESHETKFPERRETKFPERHDTRFPERHAIRFKHFYCCVGYLNDFMLLHRSISNL